MNTETTLQINSSISECSKYFSEYLFDSIGKRDSTIGFDHYGDCLIGENLYNDSPLFSIVIFSSDKSIENEMNSKQPTQSEIENFLHEILTSLEHEGLIEFIC